MTDQELFDKVSRHLLTQAAKSVDSFSRERYRGDYGFSCAIGCLIPSDRYLKQFEGRSIGDPEETSLRVAAGISEDQTNMALSLQLSHDSYSVPQWPGRLRHVANTFSLSPAIIDELEPSFRAKLQGVEA